MCFSATVSYSTAAVLVSAGAYAIHHARRLPNRHWLLWAAIPLLFGVQQTFEGMVWRQLDAGHAEAAVPYALGFHFFSHFLWLWWLGLGSYLVEPARARRRVIGGGTMLGVFCGTLLYGVMLGHPQWMSVAVQRHAIVYTFSNPYRGPIHLPITPAGLYALIVLVPMLVSSHRPIRLFGVLLAVSALLASGVYGYAYVSVWCFFAAGLSLYLVFMIRRLVAKAAIRHREPARTSDEAGLSRTP